MHSQGSITSTSPLPCFHKCFHIIPTGQLQRSEAPWQRHTPKPLRSLSLHETNTDLETTAPVGPPGTEFHRDPPDPTPHLPEEPTHPCCTGWSCRITWVLVSSGFSPSLLSFGTTTTSPTGTLTSAFAISHMKAAVLQGGAKQRLCVCGGGEGP